MVIEFGYPEAHHGFHLLGLCTYCIVSIVSIYKKIHLIIYLLFIYSKTDIDAPGTYDNP